jgi:hypothetical protein
MRTQQESNSINRVMKSWGLGSLDEPGAVQALAWAVQDHEHFGELLRACEPGLRREMYDAMSPNLRFRARSLDQYVVAAKEHAESMQFPTLEANGNLKPYMMPTVGDWPAEPPPDPDFEVLAQCPKCKTEEFFHGERKADAIQALRSAGWSWDEMTEQAYRCPVCLDHAAAAN